MRYILTIQIDDHSVPIGLYEEEIPKEILQKAVDIHNKKNESDHIWKYQFQLLWEHLASLGYRGIFLQGEDTKTQTIEDCGNHG